MGFCKMKLVGTIVLLLAVPFILLYIGVVWQSPLTVYILEGVNRTVGPTLPKDTRDVTEDALWNGAGDDPQDQSTVRSNHSQIEPAIFGFGKQNNGSKGRVNGEKPGELVIPGAGGVGVPGKLHGVMIPKRMDRMMEGGPVESSGSCNLRYEEARYQWAQLHPWNPRDFVPSEDTLPGPGCDQRLPKALIIGSKKSGTGSLVSFLLANPLIRFPRGEVHFFSDYRYKFGVEYYREFMPVTKANQTTVEKTPKYFVEEKVPSRVAKLNSSMRLILILKDPIERLISDYDHNKAGKQKYAPEKSKSLESLVLTASGEINSNYEPISVSTYDIYVRRWLRYFPRDQLLVLDGNAFIDDPLPILQACERFLGVPSYITSENLVWDETKGYYCVLRANIKPVCLPGKGTIHKQYPAAVTDKLREYFKPHVKKLETLIGQHLSWMDKYD